MGYRVYVPAIFVLNKIDAISIEELDLLYKVSRNMWSSLSHLDPQFRAYIISDVVEY